MKRKIAIPLENGVLCQHFGHCTQFSIIETEDNKITGHQKITPPPHEPGVLPAWLHSLGVDHIIAGGMGQGARVIFQERGITVTVGAPAGPPESLAAAYMRGTLPTGENVCDH